MNQFFTTIGYVTTYQVSYHSTILLETFETPAYALGLFRRKSTAIEDMYYRAVYRRMSKTATPATHTSLITPFRRSIHTLHIKQIASSEIAWSRAYDQLHDVTARRTFRENIVEGHYGVATGSPCGTGGLTLALPTFRVRSTYSEYTGIVRSTYTSAYTGAGSASHLSCTPRTNRYRNYII